MRLTIDLLFYMIKANRKRKEENMMFQKEKKISMENWIRMGLLAALMCVSAYIVIPLPFSPVPLTAQTLMVNLIAFLLSPLQAVITIVVYLLLGLVGLPVFSGGMGGPGKLFGPTGGYLFSWIFAVAVISWLKGKTYNIVRYSASAVFAGMVIIYGVGSIYMKITTGMSWSAVFAAAVLPFIPLDVVKCIFAACLAKPIRMALYQNQMVK